MSAGDNIRTRWEMDVAQAQQALRSIQTELKQADKATDDLTKSVNTQTRAMNAQVRILETQIRLMNLAEREIRRNEQAEKDLAQAKERSNQAALKQRRVAAAAGRLSQDITAGRLKLLKVTEDYTAGMKRMVTTKLLVDRAGNRVVATLTHVAGKLVEVRRGLEANVDPAVRVQQAFQRMQDQQRRAAAIHAAMIKDEASHRRSLDATTAAARRKAKAIEHVTFSLGAMGKLVATRLASRAIYAFISATRQALDDAIKLSMRIAEIQTISQDIPLLPEQWGAGIRSISDRFGFGILDAAEAAYQTLSNQVAKGAETFLFMEEAAKFAITTNSSLTDSVNLLSSALNSYEKDASHAATTSAELFKLIELGRVRSSEIANTIGNVTVIAGQLGVELSEVNAMLAQTTKAGIKARESLTQVRGIMNALLKPTEGMKDFLASLGVETGEAAIAAYGYNEVVRKMADYTNGSSSAVADLIPRIRGMSAALMALSEGGENYNKILVQMQSSQDEYAKAVELASNNLGRELTVQWTEVRNFFTADVAPAINAVLLDIGKSFKYSWELYREGGGLAEAALHTALFASGPAGRLIYYYRQRQLQHRKHMSDLRKINEESQQAVLDGRKKFIQREAELEQEANKERTGGYLRNIAEQRIALNKEASLLEEHYRSVSDTTTQLLSALASEADDNIKKIQSSIKETEKTAESITKSTEGFIKGIRDKVFQEDMSRKDPNQRVNMIRDEIKRVGQIRRQAERAGQVDLAKEQLDRQARLVEQLISLDKDRQAKLIANTLEQQRLEHALKAQGITVEERKSIRDQLLALDRERREIDSDTTGVFADNYKHLYDELIQTARKQEETLLAIQKKRVEALHKEEMRRALELAVFKAQLAKVTDFDLTKSLGRADTPELVESMRRQRAEALRLLETDAKRLDAGRLTLDMLERIKQAEKEEIRLEIKRRELALAEGLVSKYSELTEAIITNRSEYEQLRLVTNDEGAAKMNRLDRMIVLNDEFEKSSEALKDLAIDANAQGEIAHQIADDRLAIEKAITAEARLQTHELQLQHMGEQTAFNRARMARIQRLRDMEQRAIDFFPARRRYNTGGEVHGQDSVSAMLTPGEYVMNSASTRKFYSQLVGMNRGNTSVQRYNSGGEVSVGDININMTSSGNASYDVQTLGNQLRREIRRRTISFK